MIGFVVTSHSNFCLGLKAAAEMIGCKGENVAFVPLLNEGIDIFEETLRHTIKNMHEKYDALIVMCDLFYATPYNKAINIINECNYNDIVISGVNLNMYLETVLKSQIETNLQVLADTAVQSGMQGIMRIDRSVIDSIDCVEDDEII